MSYFRKGQQGRADIIVDDGQGKVLVLVECKAPRQFLSDEVIEQARRYDDVVNAKIIIVTNGAETLAFERDANGDFHQLAHLPNHTELLQKTDFEREEFEETPYEKLDLFKPFPPEFIADQIERGYIGAETSPLLHPFIFNLMEWMFSPEDKVEPATLMHTNLILDGGIRYADFGNAGGGAFGGDYRYFILKDSQANTQIISLTIMGLAKTVNDPQWGNRNGGTMLAVAIDDFNLSHMSLELRLDKYVQLHQSKAVVWHDGTLTVGKLGQAKRQVVLDYIITKAPHLVSQDGKIIIGEFDVQEPIVSNHPATLRFLDNLILYALLRDEYRLIHRQAVQA